MAYLADTNVLLRWVRQSDPQHPLALAAVEVLRDQGEGVYITAQNLVEFWSVATRPENVNGLGLTVAEADADVDRLERFFLFAPDDPSVYDEWRRLVLSVGVSGAQVHDARLVAVMHVYGLTHVLTFNPSDFTRFPGITVVRPQEMAGIP